MTVDLGQPVRGLHCCLCGDVLRSVPETSLHLATVHRVRPRAAGILAAELGATFKRIAELSRDGLAEEREQLERNLHVQQNRRRR